jgi:pyruvate kinase
MYTPQPVVTAETVASTAVNTVLDLPVDLIVIVTETGRFARLIAKYRPPVAILALSKSSEVIRSLQTTRGVVGTCIKDFTSEEDLCKQINKYCKDTHLVRSGQKAVLIMGEDEETTEETTTVKIIEIDA